MTALVIQDAAQSQTAENITLVQHNKLIVQDVIQGQGCEAVALISGLIPQTASDRRATISSKTRERTTESVRRAQTGDD